MINFKKNDGKSDSFDANRAVNIPTLDLRNGILKSNSKIDNQPYFDLDEISWITQDIGVTNEVGASTAHKLGYYLINTAEEVFSPADEKIVIDPWTRKGSLKKSLNRISNLIDRSVRERNRKVVVHCYLGLERSVLSVAWYLHTKMNMSLDEAYEVIREGRPVILDRRHWLEGKLVPDESMNGTKKLSFEEK